MSTTIPHPTGDPDLDRAIAESLRTAPPLTAAQRSKLAKLLSGGGAR